MQPAAQITWVVTTAIQSRSPRAGATHSRENRPMQCLHNRRLESTRRGRRSSRLLGLLSTLAVSGVAQAAPQFVQVNAATPETPQPSVVVPYSAAQTAGNVNVVVVGWNDSTVSVTSVTDTKGNAYSRAVGPTAFSDDATRGVGGKRS
jgi:hypothetical protein